MDKLIARVCKHGVLEGYCEFCFDSWGRAIDWEGNLIDDDGTKIQDLPLFKRLKLRLGIK